MTRGGLRVSGRPWPTQRGRGGNRGPGQTPCGSHQRQRHLGTCAGPAPGGSPGDALGGMEKRERRGNGAGVALRDDCFVGGSPPVLAASTQQPGPRRLLSGPRCPRGDRHVVFQGQGHLLVTGDFSPTIKWKQFIRLCLRPLLSLFTKRKEKGPCVCLDFSISKKYFTYLFMRHTEAEGEAGPMQRA